MPTVPKPNNSSIMPSASSGHGFRNPMSEGMATLPGHQIENMGAAVQQSSAQLSQMFAQIHNEANTARVQDAQTQIMNLINNLTTNTDRTGYADKAGKDALPDAGGETPSEVYGRTYDNHVAGIAGTLSNDAQRIALNSWAATKRRELTAKIDGHMAKEFGTFQDDVDNAAIATGGSTINARYNDPDAVNDALQGIAGAFAKKAARAGMPREWAGAKAREQQSAYLAQVANGLINGGRLEEADAFRKRHAANFTGEQGLALDTTIRHETDIGLAKKAVSDASSVMLQGNSEGAGGDMTEAEFVGHAVSGLDKDAPPGLTEQTIVMASRQFHLLSASIRDGKDHAVAAALSAVENNGGDYYGLSPDVRGAIPKDDVEAVQAHAASVTLGKVQTDPAVYQQLSDDKMLMSMSDAAFERTSLESLSPADRSVFAARRAELRDPGTTGNGPESIDRESLDAGLDARLEQLGMSPNPPEGDTEAAAAAGATRKAVTDHLLRQQRISGRKFDADGVMKTLDELFLKNVTFQSNHLVAPASAGRGLGYADSSRIRPAVPHLRLTPLSTDQAQDGESDGKTRATVEHINAANETMRLRFSKFTTFPLQGIGFPINFKDKNKPHEGVGTFGMVRNVGQKAHQGLDIKAPVGTPVVAAGAGKVVRTGFDPGYGYYIQIDHGDQLYSFYAHLQKASFPPIGTTFNAGDTIGHVGKTGNLMSDIDSHLHFELRTMVHPPKGKGLPGLKGRIDPMPYIYPLHWRYNGDPDHWGPP